MLGCQKEYFGQGNYYPIGAVHRYVFAAQRNDVSCKGPSDDFCTLQLMISKHPFVYAKKFLHKQSVPVY